MRHAPVAIREADSSGENVMDELTFWRTCCERGISICVVPKPFREEVSCWLVVKSATFQDRRLWTSSYTCDSLEQVFREVGAYLDSGVEPDRPH